MIWTTDNENILGKKLSLYWSYMYATAISPLILNYLRGEGESSGDEGILDFQNTSPYSTSHIA